MKKNLFFNWAKQNKKSLMLSILVVFITGGLVAQKAWSLKDCIEYALEKNIEIKRSEVSYKSEKADLLQSKLDLLPTLNASSSYSLGFGRSAADFSYTTETTKTLNFSAGATLSLFRGFVKFNTMKQAQLNYLTSKYDSDKIKDDISLRVAAGYLNVLYSMELVEKTEAQLDVTRIQITNTEKLVNAGTLPKGDLLEIQSQGALEEVNLINAQNQLNLAYLDLMQLLDLEASEDFQIEKPNLKIDADIKILNSAQIFNTAVGRLPEIKASEYRLQSAEKGLAIARGYRSPSISANFGWSTYYLNTIKEYLGIDPNGVPQYGETIPFMDQFNTHISNSLAFSMSIPIFNGFQTSTNVQKSKLNIQNSQYDLELAKNNVRKDIEQAYSDALAAYKMYNASLKSVASFKESFKYMEQKFSVGLENSLNYNTAKAQLAQAESDLISAKYDYIFKTKILDFYMGNPLTIIPGD